MESLDQEMKDLAIDDHSLAEQNRLLKERIDQLERGNASLAATNARQAADADQEFEHLFRDLRSACDDRDQVVLERDGERAEKGHLQSETFRQKQEIQGLKAEMEAVVAVGHKLNDEWKGAGIKGETLLELDAAMSRHEKKQ